MRGNLEHSLIYDARITGLRLSNVVTGISTTYIIPDEGSSVWIMDGGNTAKTVRLPSLNRDKYIVIGNVGIGVLNITDSVGNALVTLASETTIVFFPGTSRWVWVTTTFANTIAIGVNVVTASGPVAATDVEIQVNGSGAVVLTLPLSAAWSASAGLTGLPLSIYDISGSASTNNITINTSGGQLISGQASLTIANDYGGFMLRPKADGGWIFR